MSNTRMMMLATAVNLALLVLTHGGFFSVEAQGPERVLRARGLEIVDEQGRIRASITIEAPVTVDGRAYPETVLLRLRDPKSGPVVKLQAASNGSALGLSDDTEGGIRAMANGSENFVEVKQRDGRTRVIKP